MSRCITARGSPPVLRARSAWSRGCGNRSSSSRRNRRTGSRLHRRVACCTARSVHPRCQHGLGLEQPPQTPGQGAQEHQGTLALIQELASQALRGGTVPGQHGVRHLEARAPRSAGQEGCQGGGVHGPFRPFLSQEAAELVELGGRAVEVPVRAETRRAGRPPRPSAGSPARRPWRPRRWEDRLPPGARTRALPPPAPGACGTSVARRAWERATSRWLPGGGLAAYVEKAAQAASIRASPSSATARQIAQEDDAPGSEHPHGARGAHDLPRRHRPRRRTW
jgi:hypothetical protein